MHPYRWMSEEAVHAFFQRRSTHGTQGLDPKCEPLFLPPDTRIRSPRLHHPHARYGLCRRDFLHRTPIRRPALGRPRGEPPAQLANRAPKPEHRPARARRDAARVTHCPRFAEQLQKDIPKSGTSVRPRPCIRSAFGNTFLAGTTRQRETASFQMPIHTRRPPQGPSQSRARAAGAAGCKLPRPKPQQPMSNRKRGDRGANFLQRGRPSPTPPTSARTHAARTPPDHPAEYPLRAAPGRRAGRRTAQSSRNLPHLARRQA